MLYIDSNSSRCLLHRESVRTQTNNRDLIKNSLIILLSSHCQHNAMAGNDHVIDIFTSEDIENISLYIFSVSYYILYNKIFYVYINISFDFLGLNNVDFEN